MRTLTNNYGDCKIIKIDPSDPTSPYGVIQEGCDPNDPTYRTRMFYLQRDGKWIDEVARSTRPDSEGGDILFEKSAEALQLLSKLRGTPVVRDLLVSKEDVKNYLARVGSGSSPGELMRQFLARYRATLNADPDILIPCDAHRFGWLRLLQPIRIRRRFFHFLGGLFLRFSRFFLHQSPGDEDNQTEEKKCCQDGYEHFIPSRSQGL